MTSSRTKTGRMNRLALSCLWISAQQAEAFSSVSRPDLQRQQYSRLSMVQAPPGSGYAAPEDERSELPDTYEPMMEFPGTMRPGRTPENMPFHDLPIADTDPDPVPWPHFQQIEWHHQWAPPHPHPIPMEEFIEQHGRWATPEMEAAMRAGNRRDARQRREMQEEEKRETLILDDDDDEQDEPQNLGDNVFGKLGSTADEAITAAATSPNRDVEKSAEEDTTEDDDGELDDFLLDLGLDAFSDDDETKDAGEEDTVKPAKAKPATAKPSVTAGLEDVSTTDDDDDDTTPEISETSASVTSSIDVDDDDDLDLGLDEEDDITSDGVSTVPLEDFGDNDGLDTEDFFGDGGFDYDSGGGDDSDGGDSW